MKHTLLSVAGVAALCFAVPAAAQDPYPQHCPPDEEVTQDTCVKAIDLFKFLTPQLAATLAGGNAILGSGGALGGLGHVTFGLRLNALSGHLPRVDRTGTSSTSGAARTDYDTRSQVLAFPVADLGIGLFAGIPVGLTNIGGLDLLVSAAYLPEFSGSNVSVTVPGGSIRLGFGARLGIIQESLLLPGVAVSVLRRGLPTVNVSALLPERPSLLLPVEGRDSIAVRDFEITTTSWRITAGKNLLMFGLAVGAGQDRYSQEADIVAHVALAEPFTRRVDNVQTARLDNQGPDLSRLTRTNYFANLSTNLPFFRLVGEIGQVSGGEIRTFNTFGGVAPDRSRVYGSIGARIGW